MLDFGGKGREISISTSVKINSSSYFVRRYYACVCFIILCLFHVWERCIDMLVLACSAGVILERHAR